MSAQMTYNFGGMLRVILLIVTFLLVVFVVSRANLFGHQQDSFVPAIGTLMPSIVLDCSTKTCVQSVPFVAQAPTGKWSDQREQDGCEEAVSYMAYLWVTGKKPSVDLAKQEAELLKISDWEEKTYGSYHDTASADTVARILQGYFKIDNAQARYDITLQDIKQELAKGNLVIVPANGQVLQNPFYTAPGPERHNLVIKGFDPATREFITNDNGTRHGGNYRYQEQVLFEAIRDYPTGDHKPIEGTRKVMILVRK